MSEQDLHQNLYDDLSFDELEPRPELTPEIAKEFFPVHKEEPIDTMDEPVIIEAAYPGWQPGGDHYPAVPGGPEETTEGLIESVEAGAAAVHTHPRDENGIPQLQSDELLVEVLDPVFEECGEVLTLSHTWKPATGDNNHADYVTNTKKLLEMGDGNKYCQAALVLPIAHRGAAFNSRSSVIEGIRYMKENDIKPLFQLYDSHAVQEFKHKVFDEGELTEEDGPHIMNINAGKHHSHNISQDPWSYLQLLAAMGTVEDTIDDAIVNVYAGGRNWLPIMVLGMIAGATVFRVGIEDAYWLYPHRDDLIPSNAEAIELAVDIAESLGREVITDPDEARDYLGIEYTSPR